MIPFTWNIQKRQIKTKSSLVVARGWEGVRGLGDEDSAGLVSEVMNTL